MCIGLQTNYLHAQDKFVTVQLKWLHRFEFAGYYAAEIKGFYKQKGIDVRLKQGDRFHDPATEVLRNRATFGVGDCDLLINYEKGDPIVAMSAIFQHSPYIILGTPNKNIYSPSDLIGKRIMTSDDYGWPQMKVMLYKEGIPLDSITEVPQSWRLTDLITNKVDAITGNIGVEPFEMEKKGLDYTFIQPLAYGVDFYSDILFTQRSVIANNPTMVENFRLATIEGWNYAISHVDEMANYILTLPGVANRGVTREALLFEAEQMRRLMAPELVEIGHMNEGRWQHIADLYNSVKYTSRNVSIEAFLYSHEQNYIKEFVHKAVYIAIAILLIIVGIVLYSLSLKRAVRNRTVQLQKEVEVSNDTRKKLMVSEERLDLATEGAGIGIWDWNVVDNTIYLSGIWKKMLGYTPDELPNTIDTFFNFIHPDDKEEVLEKEAMHIQGKSDRLQFICRMMTKPGVYKWVLSISRAGIRNPQGRATRILGIQLDIDDIKKKELELNQLSQELLVSNKELKQFAYITSHNLRSPVANLLMLMQMFKKEELKDKNKLLFDKTDLSIKQLNQTLDDLNEILSARFTAEKEEDVFFETVLLEVEQSISQEIYNSKTIIHYDFEQAESILYSKKTLQSILLNLITNAIKYAKPNVPPFMIISTWQSKDWITLTVKDEGIGIDLNKHGNKLFGLYQRFHLEAKGKGLGLYIIKNQVEAQNGNIQVESKPGVGTTFTVNFARKSVLHEGGVSKYFVSG